MKKFLPIILLFVCILADAQNIVHRLNFDKVPSPNSDKKVAGAGSLTIDDNLNVVITGKVGNKVTKYSFKMVSASVISEAFIALYSVNGNKDDQLKNPYVLILGSSVIYSDDSNPNSKITYSLASSNEKNNDNVLEAMMSSFKDHTGIFKNFRGEKDYELPLKIDGYSDTHTFTLTGKGDDKVFPIRTKSGKYISDTSFKEYEAWTDASWGEIKYKTESAILMRYDDNTTGSTRTANVYVKAGDVTTHMIVSQPPLRAIVNKVWIEHNKWSGLTKGMKIHVDFTTYGVIGMQGECVAYFNFSNGQKIMDYNGYYRTTDGQACCFVNFTPPYESSNYNDFVLFMPYTELHLSGHADCKCNVEVHIGGERAYGESVGFTYN